jgi:anoctamin-10
MVVPFALKKLMPKAKKLASKTTQKKTEPSVSASIVEDEEEKQFMEKVHKEVAMEEYNIYTDYVEMVIQVTSTIYR